MALFYKMQLTAMGLALQTKVQGGGTLCFSRIALGDGKLSGAAIAELRDLISERVSVPADRGRFDNANTYSAGGYFTNRDLQTGFTWRELGLFADDPDEGEILYCYANAQDTGDYIPGVGAEVYEKVIYCHIGVGNAANVTVQTSSAIYPTQQELEQAVEGRVPNSRTVNGKPLVDDIVLNSADVGAVPTTRKVNGKALNGDIALTAADVGARPSNWTPTAAEVGADTAGSAAAVQTALTSHTGNKSNPHGVTAAQVGADAAGSAATVQTALTSHTGNKSNPHGVTAAQVGAATAAQGTKADGALQRSGGTMTGQLTASNPAVGTSAVRNIYAGTADLTAGSSSLATGSLYFVYEA